MWTRTLSAILGNQKSEAYIYDQRKSVRIEKRLAKINKPETAALLPLADALVKKSVWIVGGDGWGVMGSADHVLASARIVNILVLDTEVYSTPEVKLAPTPRRGKVAGGKLTAKDLGLTAINYRNVCVAMVSMGAKDEHTLKSSKPNPITDRSTRLQPPYRARHRDADRHENQKAAVDSNNGSFTVTIRPRSGRKSSHAHSAPPKLSLEQYLYTENRFKMLTKSRPEDTAFAERCQTGRGIRRKLYENMASKPARRTGRRGLMDIW